MFSRPIPGRANRNCNIIFNMIKTNIAILGPGAVGGFLAALLARAGHNVTCICRSTTAKIIRDQGINFKSAKFGDSVERVHALEQLDSPQDILMVSTKATTLKQALERIPADYVKQAVIMPLLNGFEHNSLLRKLYGRRIAPASISMEAVYEGPGRIRHTTDFSFIRTASDDISPKQLQSIAELIKDCGINVILAPSEADVIWTKLTRLNALACTTAASGQPLGWVRTDNKWKQHLAAVVREGVAVARAEGFDTSEKAVLDQLAKLPETLGSSLQRDVEAGRAPELEAIPGAVVRAGARHSIPCPVIKDMIQSIQVRMQTIEPVS